jgi:hypothetical protein
MKVNTGSGMKPNSFKPIPEQRSASPESPGCSTNAVPILRDSTPNDRVRAFNVEAI